MTKEPECCQRKVVWLVMALCAAVALILLTAY